MNALKNITIAMLVITFAAISLFYPRQSEPKPEVFIVLPEGYCGEFVVFWDTTLPPSDEPATDLSYTYHPQHPNAVVIKLPETYWRAGLRFIYADQEDTISRNPIFKMTGIGSISFDPDYAVDENGWTYNVPGSETTVGADNFEILSGGECSLDFRGKIIPRTKTYKLIEGL